MLAVYKYSFTLTFRWDAAYIGEQNDQAGKDYTNRNNFQIFRSFMHDFS